MISREATYNRVDEAGGTVAGRMRRFLERWRYGLIALVVLAQAAVLIQMIVGREMLIAHGRQIDLKVVPVDPRDLFRGDYVTLSYEISAIPVSKIVGRVKAGQRVFVRLTQTEAGFEARSVSRERPETASSSNDVLLAAHVIYTPHETAEVADPGSPTGRSLARVALRYGIEKFFVPEGQGRDIEKEVTAKDVVAHIVVGDDGTAAIRALSVAGKRYEKEPLF